jgi:glycosyltransferase involved in cell wall biosynthesis
MPGISHVQYGLLWEGDVTVPTARGRVAMLVKNSFEYDARVRKEATSLIADGWRVTVVALQVPEVTSLRETTADHIDVIRVPRLYGRFAGLAGPSTTTPGTQSKPPLARALSRPAVRMAGPALRASNDVVVARRMIAAAVSTDPDVVHSHDLNTLGPGLVVARRSSAKLVYDAHELHRARSGMTPRQRRRALELEQRLMPAADLVVTATETWADLLAADLAGLRPLVVRNVPERSATESTTADLKARLGIDTSTPVLVYQGSIQRGRGIEVTIEALRALPECHLAIIGYGSHRPVLEALADELGVCARVHFTGPIPNTELIAWTRSCEVGTCLIEDTSLSYRTSLPNKLFEYMHAGVPVVASDFQEMGAIVRRTRSGEVCDPADAASVANAIEMVLADRDRYAAAARRAASDFVWEHEVVPLVEAYRDLAAGR